MTSASQPLNHRLEDRRRPRAQVRVAHVEDRVAERLPRGLGIMADDTIAAAT